MKVANLVAQFLRDNGVRYVFCVSGGASLHLIHGIAETKGITFVCPQNEQSASFAADADARLNGLGCALATSGPGATNLLTGIATSYYDSVPVIYITGNQTVQRMKTYGTRQYGFQSTPIVPMVRDITKYAVTISKPEDVELELGIALTSATTGRKGPVLVDICDDVQRASV